MPEITVRHDAREMVIGIGSDAVEASRQASRALVQGDRAETEAARAETNAGYTEEFLQGISYVDQTAGELGTAEGQFFRVWNGDTPRTYTRYQRTAGGSVEVDPLATTTSPLVQGYVTRADLKAFAPTAGTRAYLKEPGRAGEFVFRAGDYSAELAAFPNEGFFIESDQVAGSLGAWVRTVSGFVTPEMAGAESTRLYDRTTAFPTINDAGIALIANSSSAIKEAWDYSIEYQVPCVTLGQAYKIFPGVLHFDNGHRRTLGPTIFTGEGTTTLYVDHDTDPSNDDPLIKFSSGTYGLRPGESVDENWEGGYLGGLRFVDTTGHAVTTRHGLAVEGWRGARWGAFTGDQLRGYVLNCPLKTVSGNPDFYHVSFVECSGIFARGCEGAILNDNGQGFNGCRFNYVNGIQSRNDVIKGRGAANNFGVLGGSFGQGWALNSNNTPWGALRSCIIEAAEIDGQEFGILLDIGLGLDLRDVRFIIRHDFNPNHPGVSVPRVLIRNTGGEQGKIICAQTRIDPGNTLAGLPVFLDLNNFAHPSFEVDFGTISDNASLGFTGTHAQILVNGNPNRAVVIRANGRVLEDSRSKPIVQLEPNAPIAIPSSGWPNSSKLMFQTAGRDDFGMFKPSDGWVLVDRRATMHVDGFHLHCAPGAGVRIRMAVARDRGGVINYFGEHYAFGNGASAQGFAVAPVSFKVEPGDKIYPIADCAAGISTVALLGATSANYMKVRIE